MKKPILTLSIASLLLMLPVAGIAQDVPIHEQPTCAELLSMLDGGASAKEVVRAAMAAGMTLAEATVYAMECGGETNRDAIVVAGIGLAGNMAQAQTVANAVMATDPRNGELAAVVDAALSDFAKTLPQPNVYEDEYTPTGTDVSPAT